MESSIDIPPLQFPRTNKRLAVWNRSFRRIAFEKRVKSILSHEAPRVAKKVTYKAYIDNIKAKTGKGPDDFRKLAKQKGLVKHAELLSWLKSDIGLGHGHATAIIYYIREPRLAKKQLLEDTKKGKARK